jgi:hypothetical protein
MWLTPWRTGLPYVAPAHRRYVEATRNSRVPHAIHTFGYLLFAVASPDTNTVDNIALLGLVSHTARLVRSGRARSTVDHIKLTVLPAPVSRSLNQGPSAQSHYAYRTRRRKRRTSDCFFLYSSVTYLYAPMVDSAGHVSACRHRAMAKPIHRPSPREAAFEHHF